MSPSEKKTSSCSNCRKIKRKCDGGNPCNSCSKRNITCNYNSTDRRSQRYSVGYIKSLETNNDVLENALADLVALRDSPEELAAKLESISMSLPKKLERPDSTSSDILGRAEFQPSESESTELPYVTETDQYFGAGSVYHRRGAPTQEQEPLLASKSATKNANDGLVTLEEDFEYVASLVRGYFTHQYHGTHHTLFDKNRILLELENRNFAGPFLNKQLVYAICANCESLTYAEADAYCDFVLKDLFQETMVSSIAVSQCYTLLALHCASKGQISKAWLFAGIGSRVGLDVGFDMSHGEDSCPIANRCFVGTLIIDQYLAMSLGRRSSLQQNSVPVLRLKGESDVDYLSAKYAVELIEMTRYMVRSTYQPVTFDKDPKVNYLLKFNRSKVFNMKLLKWRQKLDPACSWSYASLKASKIVVSENHTLKFLYYYMLIFLNKPFLHVPKQHSTVFVIEEMAKEVHLIVHSKLLKLEEETGLKLHSRDPSSTESSVSTNKFCTASMDICVVMLLANILMTLMTSQPEHYIHLEKHFKAFAHYTNYINLRKYDAVEKPMMALLKKFEAFKVRMKIETAGEESNSPGHDSCQMKDEHNSDSASRSSPPTSDYSSSTSRINAFEYREISNKPYTESSGWAPPSTSTQDNIPPVVMSAGWSREDPGLFSFDPWWQEINHGNAQAHTGFPTSGAPERGFPTSEASERSSPNYSQHFHGGSQIPSFSHAQSLNHSNSINSQPLLRQELLQQFGGSYANVDQPGIYDYDHLPKSDDPVDQTLNSLFTYKGEELAMNKEHLDWEELFKGQDQVYSM